MGHIESDVLIERIQDDSTDPMIVPRSMDKQHFTQIAKLSNRHVGGPRCLKTFNTADTDAHMCCLNHRYIVRTITNGQQYGFQVSFHQLDDKGFLKRGNTTLGSLSTIRTVQCRRMTTENLPADHSFAHNSQVQKQLFHILLESICQRFTIDNKSKSFNFTRSRLTLNGLKLLRQVVSRC